MCHVLLLLLLRCTAARNAGGPTPRSYIGPQICTSMYVRSSSRGGSTSTRSTSTAIIARRPLVSQPMNTTCRAGVLLVNTTLVRVHSSSSTRCYCLHLAAKGSLRQGLSQKSGRRHPFHRMIRKGVESDARSTLPSTQTAYCNQQTAALNQVIRQ